MDFNNVSVYRQNTGKLNFGNASNNSPLSYQPGATLPQVGNTLPPIPSTKPQPNLQDAHSFIDSQVNARKANQSPVGAATTDKNAEKVKNDLSDIASGRKTFEDVSNSKWYQSKGLYNTLLSVGASLMSGENASQTLQNAQAAAAQGNADEERAKAQAQIKQQAPDLLQKGYSQQSIQQAINTGDWGALQYEQLSPQQQREQQLADVQNQRAYEQSIYERNRADQLADQQRASAGNVGSWTAPNKQGISINTKTGETKNVFGTGNQPAVNENGIPTTASPVTTSDGQRVYVDMNQKPIKQGSVASFIGYDEKGNQLTIPLDSLPKSRGSEATQQQGQLLHDLATVETGTERSLKNITGITGSVGDMPFGADTESKLLGKDGREVYAAAKRIQGAMGNAGIAEAKAMGASGINTEAEAKRFFAAMPQLDYSSPEALKKSIGVIRSKVSAWNGTNKEGSLTPATTGASNGFDAKGFLNQF